MAGVGGGILFGLEKSLWLNYWWLAVGTGILMMLIDVISNPVWLVQIRGVTVFVKLALLVMMVMFPAWDSTLLVMIIIMSSVISHAPGKLRYYSVCHKKVIISNYDTKG